MQAKGTPGATTKSNANFFVLVFQHFGFRAVNQFTAICAPNRFGKSNRIK
jgi:hypothetical protein